VSGLCRRHGISALTRNAKSYFAAFARTRRWAGNFRELERFFNILQREMLVCGTGTASAAMMLRAIAEMGAPADEVGPVSGSVGDASSGHPLLKELAGVPARDRATLEFAFKCAETAKNCRQAAERFFEGGRQSNPQTSFMRWLERFGFAYDDEIPGHIARRVR